MCFSEKISKEKEVMEHKVSLMEITQAQNITLLFSNRIRLGGAGVG